MGDDKGKKGQQEQVIGYNLAALAGKYSLGSSEAQQADKSDLEVSRSPRNSPNITTTFTPFWSALGNPPAPPTSPAEPDPRAAAPTSNAKPEVGRGLSDEAKRILEKGKRPLPDSQVISGADPRGSGRGGSGR